MFKSRKRITPLALLIFIALYALKAPEKHLSSTETPARTITATQSENLPVISRTALNFGDDKKKKLEEASFERKVDMLLRFKKSTLKNSKALLNCFEKNFKKLGEKVKLLAGDFHNPPLSKAEKPNALHFFGETLA